MKNNYLNFLLAGAAAAVVAVAAYYVFAKSEDKDKAIAEESSSGTTKLEIKDGTAKNTTEANVDTSKENLTDVKDEEKQTEEGLDEKISKILDESME